jgi:hypothetical protein
MTLYPRCDGLVRPVVPIEWDENAEAEMMAQKAKERAEEDVVKH